MKNSLIQENSNDMPEKEKNIKFYILLQIKIMN